MTYPFIFSPVDSLFYQLVTSPQISDISIHNKSRKHSETKVKRSTGICHKDEIKSTLSLEINGREDKLRYYFTSPFATRDLKLNDNIIEKEIYKDSI